MDQDENRNFIARTEALVKPQDVTTISFLGDFNRFLPLKIQDKIMRKGSLTIPYMGFIVDPYCFFLAYRITDPDKAQAALPPGYELVDTSLFAGETPCPLVIAGAFSVRTSAFIGNRIEFYLIARNKGTGMVSWIIVDYETNTNNYEPKNGFGGYTADPAVFTTTPYGELLVDFVGKSPDRRLSFTARLEPAPWRDLNAELWVEGNLSIDYGGDLRVSSSQPFSLIFDPVLMQKAQEVPLQNVVITGNTYLPGFFDPAQPVSAAVFPYSQHFIIKQDLVAGAVSDRDGLLHLAGEFLGRTGFKTMSGDDIKKPLFRGMLISSAVTYTLIVILLLKVLFG